MVKQWFLTLGSEELWRLHYLDTNTHTKLNSLEKKKKALSPG